MSTEEIIAIEGEYFKRRQEYKNIKKEKDMKNYDDVVSKIKSVIQNSDGSQRCFYIPTLTTSRFLNDIGPKMFPNWDFNGILLGGFTICSKFKFD